MLFHIDHEEGYECTKLTFGQHARVTCGTLFRTILTGVYSLRVGSALKLLVSPDSLLTDTSLRWTVSVGH